MMTSVLYANKAGKRVLKYTGILSRTGGGAIESPYEAVKLEFLLQAS